MKANRAVDMFINEYCFILSDKERNEFVSQGYDVRSLGETKEQSERLINLIMKGRKRAVSRLFTKKASTPKIDSYAVILDHKDEPRCLVKYTSFAIKPFSKIDLAFVEEEGESLEGVREWANDRRKLFGAKDARFNEASLILCEQFKLVFKAV